MRLAPHRILAICLVAVAAVLPACSGGADAVDQSSGGEFRFVSSTGKGETVPVARRQRAPEISGARLGGGRLDLADLRGKVVVLNFWAAWCAPCRVESPEFDQVYRATKARGVEFVGVNIKDDEQNAEEFVRVWKISYPSLFDPNGKSTLRFDDFRPGGLPYTIVIDKHGRVAAVYVTALLRDEIQPVVERLAEEA